MCIAVESRRNALTLFWENSDADARVTQFDEGGVSSPPVILSDQEDILGTDVAVNKMLFLLRVEKRKQSAKETLGKKTSVTPFTDLVVPNRLVPTRKFMACASCFATSSFHRMFIELLFFFR